ncbi:MAG: hypothetical protein ABIJ03_03555 [Patescibacteria group bacterium]|nr:hypothetical protein [Patescibacteria group bacterium]
MKNNNRQKLLDFITKNHQVKPIDMLDYLKISRVALHRYLKQLLEENEIIRLGSPPRVFYAKSDNAIKVHASINWPKNILQKIEANFTYIGPDGVIADGVQGFMNWAKATKQDNNLLALGEEYVKLLHQAKKHRSKDGLIHALEKVTQTFNQVNLDELLYQDFYSLPKFGKTKLGSQVLYAKQSQSTQLMEQLTETIQPVIEKIIANYQIEAVGFIPHSIKRTQPLLPTLERILSLPMPSIDLVKVYRGSVPIAQKSLSRLSERIDNARQTIMVNQKVRFRNVLIIDDAVGSGATLNETALKLKEQYGVKKVIGYAIVGSLKGFPVISEI